MLGTEAKFRPFLRYFAMDFTATNCAELTRLSRRSATDIYGRLRQKIARWCQHLAPIQGTIEVDESYFGPKRVPGKRGRGAAKKTLCLVFLNAAEMCTPRLFQMLKNQRFSTLYVVK